MEAAQHNQSLRQAPVEKLAWDLNHKPLRSRPWLFSGLCFLEEKIFLWYSGNMTDAWTISPRRKTASCLGPHVSNRRRSKLFSSSRMQWFLESHSPDLNSPIHVAPSQSVRQALFRVRNFTGIRNINEKQHQLRWCNAVSTRFTRLSRFDEII